MTKKDLQIKEYEQQIESLSQQVNSFNQTVEGLNQDLSKVMKKLTDESVGAKNPTVETQDSVDTVNLANEDGITEEAVPMQKLPVRPSAQQPSRPGSFSQVKNLLEKAGGSQNAPQGGMPPMGPDAL